VERKIINPWKWQNRLGFVQAIEVTGGHRVLYCAGQVSVDADGKPVHADDIGAQLNRAIDNLRGRPRMVRHSFNSRLQSKLPPF
jgi:enamine deaminase RidA (YjgF/YER057c/UK114 family)